MERALKRLDTRDGVALVFVIATAFLYTREIGNDFLWGHDGGNGAPFWNAAENSIRFGVLGQAKDYTNLSPPTPADLNTHHPLLLHFHLVVTRALLGKMEWAGRLVPFIYSTATLTLLYRAASTLWNRTFGLAALAIYALTPLHLVFATMIDHEQGGIFWTLLACHAAVLTLLGRAGRSGLRVVVLASTFALQFAWGSYFVLASLGAVALLYGWRAPDGPVRDRARRLTKVLLLTGLANLAGFFAMIYLTKGSLTDMRAAFAQRSSEAPGYGASMLERALDLYGPVLLGLAAAGLARLSSRARAGRWRTRDALTVSFLAGQVALSLAFRNAGRIHSYWTYFAGVPCALLGAEALVAALDSLRSRAPRTLVALGVMVLLFQANFALAKQEWGLSTGHAAYMPGFDDQFEQVQTAKWLNARYGRDVTYLLHASLAARSEIFHYLDAPRIVVESLTQPSSEPCRTRACVLFVDLRGLRDGVALATLAKLASSRSAALHAGHLLVVDLTGRADEPRAYRLEPRPASAAYRWFVNGRHAPASWVAIDGAKEILAQTLRELAAPEYVAESSKDGVALGEPCPRDFALVGIVTKQVDGTVRAMQAGCSLGERSERTRWMGDPSRGEEREVWCRPGERVIGIRLPSANDVGSVALRCRGRAQSPDAPSGEPGYSLACPEGMTAVSLHARRTESLVGIGIGCAP